MAMAAQQLRASSGILSLLPRISSPSVIPLSRWTIFPAREFRHPLLPLLSLAIPAFQLRIPSFLEDIWESILRAVPKKKTSHSKKRHRQMAGKALKDVNSFCVCPGCGQTKRMHRLCPHCMQRIHEVWKEDNPTGKFI